MNSGGREALDERSGPSKNERRWSAWLKRLGIAGFLFFLFKGLAWLFFGAAMVKYLGCTE